MLLFTLVFSAGQNSQLSSQYVEEAQKILDDFLDSFENHPQADRAFVDHLRMLVKQGVFTKRTAIKDAVEALKGAVPDES